MARVPEPDQTPEGPAYQGRLLDRPEEEVVDQGVAFDVQTLMSRRIVLGLVGAGVGGVALAACSTGTTSTNSSPTTGTTSTGSTGGGSATATTEEATGATSSDSATTTSESASQTATGSATSSDAELPAGEIPDETAGPYPGDGSNGPDVLQESGIVRSDLRTSLSGGQTVTGVALSFTLRITDMAQGDIPFEGVAVYAWHCDALGQYSMYSEGVEDQDWLRGVQVANADGEVTFTSIFPGCYTGRWPHIHFEVYPDVDATSDAANAIATSQLALPQEACDAVYQLAGYEGSSQNLAQITLDSDNVFGEDGGELQLASVSGDTDTGYIASLVVRVDTTTEPAAGGGMGGGGEAPGGGGGQPPGGGGPGGNG